jgi:hypothetical protein
MTDNRYQLSGMTFPAGNLDPFDLWNVTGAPAVVSYSLDQPPQPEDPFHLVKFASLTEGLQDLQTKQVVLAGQGQVLDDLERRLARLMAGAESLSFAVSDPPPPEFEQPERDLQAALQRVQMPSFAADTEQDRSDLEAAGQWRKLLDQIRDTISRYAHVETAIGDSPIGRTIIGWTGDFRTIWTPAVTLAGMEVHRQNVDVTLQWRLGTIRFVGVVGAGAANIALKAGVAQLLVLPAVWNFVKDVLKEWRKLQAIKKQAA